MKLSEKLKYKIKRHLSDATAIISILNPIYAILETQIANMSNAVSINSRLYNTGLSYAILASLTKVRDFSKESFGIIDKEKGKVYIHDILFTLASVVAIKPIIYLISGETDWKKIAIGTGASLGLGGLIAGPMLHFIDIYRDLTGVKESERTPGFLKRKSKGIKKTIAAGILATSIGITGLYYYARDKLSSDKPQLKQNIEQIVETSYRGE